MSEPSEHEIMEPQQQKLENKKNKQSKDDHQESITIMTYNILAQSLCRRDLYPESGDALKWKNRRPQLIKEILHYHPDVACFQEMDYDNYNSTFKPEFEKVGYETFFYKSIGNDKKRHGCCIIWKIIKFKKLKHLTLEFDQIGVPTMPTNCIGVIVSLEFNQNFFNNDKPNPSKSGIVIGTTHLYWRPQCMYERTRQCLLLFENLIKINEEFGFVAFMVGDFNSSPIDPAYKLMIGKDPLTKEEIKNLKDSMKHYKSDRTLLNTTDNPSSSSSMVPSLTTASIESSKTGDLIKPPLNTLISSPSPTLLDLLLKFSEFPQCISLYSKYYSLIDPENVKHNEPKFTNYGKFFSGALDYIFHVNKSSHRISTIIRGNSLINDLRLLINNSRYSDLEIQCNDGIILYGCRAILAARSNVFNHYLFNNKRNTAGFRMIFSEIDSITMIIILEFMYTGSIQKEFLKIENSVDVFNAAEFFQLVELQNIIIQYLQESFLENLSDNLSPYLLSKTIRIMSPPNNELIDLLVKYVVKISLDNIPYGQLSLEALNCLLSRISRTIAIDNSFTSFSNNGYSILRYAILTSARLISREAENFFENRLPSSNLILQDNYQIDYSNDNNFLIVSLRISEIINPLFEFIDFYNYSPITSDNEVFIVAPPIPYNTKPHEPSNIIIHNSQNNELKWDELMLGPNLIIEDQGRKVNTTIEVETAQSTRVKYLMTNGIYEWDIIIGKKSKFAWIGVCSEDYNFPYFSGSQPNAWVLGLDGYCYHNNNQGIKILNTTIKAGSRVTVQLDMDKRRCSFIINKKIYFMSVWENLSSKLYPLATLRYPSSLKVQPPKNEKKKLINK
ncbi:1029_t:CDS:2 [Diversispora eburnea]|uniref:1029_t:CDS:1 n=1 Tax=Diversispora eburnea TaxID=1213867 RepID=A0A9N8V8U7_9GLOM|nr:1029_t:CDS:2 [Diversispora eburnea]